ncbi:hypothetical protein AYK24_00055 [Thermoplasmatales archaeon SG8-52-4]|nr:MAG: hypothetical protein AYK24_00055 [Thermoplasmatales archaeon SG8-52-4]
MRNKAARVGAEFADRYLGHEDNIIMGTSDARYRYYQWLRMWYGFNKKEATNKCPFYQFMFWGSLLLLVTLIPFLVLKLVEILVLKPLSWIWPEAIDDIFDLIEKSKLMASWVFAGILMVVSGIVSLFLYSNLLAWIGFGIFWIYSIPWWILTGVWAGLVWLVLDGIPLVLYGIGWLIFTLGDLIWAFIDLPWLSILFAIGLGLGCIVAFGLVMIILYKIGVWFFRCRLTRWTITQSCKVRDWQEKRREKFKDVLFERQKQKKMREAEKAAAKRELERLRLEFLAKKGRKKEKESPLDVYVWNLFSGIWKVLVIFPGQPLKWIAHIILWIFEGLQWVASGICWILKKFGDFLVVIWSLATETISNHCPPIDFIAEFTESGMLVPAGSHQFVFTSDDNSKHKIYVYPEDFPKGFTMQRYPKGRPVKINYGVKTPELEEFKRLRDYYGGDPQPMETYVVYDIIGIQKK